MTKVFISHKREDSYQAEKIASILKQNNIDFYLDVLDTQLAASGEELTRHLRGKLNDCSHLIALLSYATRFSWWVPFEIGLATEKEYPISSYISSTVFSDIPDYLKKWPVLLNENDLKKYIDLLKRDRYSLLLESSMDTFNKPKNYAEAFHKRMKAQLNQ